MGTIEATDLKPFPESQTPFQQRITQIAEPVRVHIDGIEGAFALLEALGRHHPGTLAHCLDSGDIAGRVMQSYGYPDEITTVVATAMTFHDIGKLTVPVSILDYPGPIADLSLGDQRLLRRHARAGYDIFTSLGRPLEAALIGRHHEENPDFDSRDIPKEAYADPNLTPFVKIITIIDQYHARKQSRGYKPAMSAEESYRIGALERPSFIPLLQRIRDLDPKP